MKRQRTLWKYLWSKPLMRQVALPTLSGIRKCNKSKKAWSCMEVIKEIVRVSMAISFNREVAAKEHMPGNHKELPLSRAQSHRLPQRYPLRNSNYKWITLQILVHLLLKQMQRMTERHLLLISLILSFNWCLLVFWQSNWKSRKSYLLCHLNRITK